MYFYEIGYYDYECSPTTVLVHSQKFTENEFNEMVLNCYVKSSKVAQKNHNDWYSKEENRNHDYYFGMEGDPYKYIPRIEDLYSHAIGCMIDDYGFNHLKVEYLFCVESTSDIIGDKFPSGGSKELQMLRNRFNLIEPRDNKINDILDGRDS